MEAVKVIVVEVIREEVRSVSGIHFRLADVNDDLMNNSEKISYMIYPNDELTGGIASIQKFVRMFAIPYQIVLIDEGNRENICFLLSENCADKEEMDSTMGWIADTHPEWVVVDCRNKGTVPKVVGYRIANNLFHARKLALQGEILG